MPKENDFSTRRVILNMLKTKGALSVSEMSKQLGITEMAVRRHLNTLERDGLIDSEIVRQPMGRPMHLYSLTEQAEDLFPKNYHHLTLDLLGELEREEGDQLVGKLFERRKLKLIGKYSQQMEGKGLEARVAVLTEIQNSSGYMAEWEADAEGGFTLREYNCPISKVANQYNHACQCELSLFESLLETGVERTECLAKGGSKCVYKIQERKA